MPAGAVSHVQVVAVSGGGERMLTPAAAVAAEEDAWNNDDAVWLSAKGPWDNNAFECAEAEPPSDPLLCRLDAELPSRPGSRRKTVVDQRPR